VRLPLARKSPERLAFGCARFIFPQRKAGSWAIAGVALRRLPAGAVPPALPLSADENGTFLFLSRFIDRFARREIIMENAGVGWIAAIIIGGIAGWLAEKFMNSNMGLLMNIVLGIVGAIVANWILGLLNVQPLAGWLGYLITGFVGACILIALGRVVRR
jgi:uncharacterized membrane protein YeaQ/YmgE (transglycosylase-associated protein family)